MILPKTFAPLIIALAALISGRASAIAGLDATPWLQKLTEDRRDWTLHALGGDVLGLRLTDDLRLGAIDLDEAMAHALKSATTLPLALKNINEPQSALSASVGTKSAGYELQFAGLPVCNVAVRAHQLADGSVAVFGSLPTTTDAAVVELSAWPSADDAMAAARQALIEREAAGGDEAVRTAASRCYAAHARQLLPAWRLTVSAAGLEYDVTAGADQAFFVSERFLPVSGKARIYPQNSKDGLKDVELKDLKGDGTLTGNLMAVVVPTGFAAAKGANNIFNFDPTDAKFVQPNLYAHVYAQYEYVKSLGYQWPKGKTLEIRPHLNAEVGFDNAFFKFPTAAETTLTGTIKLGDGDGVQLANLAVDGDVTAHEFNHQIVHEYLKTVTKCSETLAIHEGLADFFAFARTGDACLGETICPEGSSLCITDTCLRTALVAAKYGDDDWKEWSSGDKLCYTHNSGQVFSGLLWDMRGDDQIPPADLARLTYRAVQLFKFDSGFRDFLLALFLADNELFKGKHRTILKRAMVGRGLGTLVKDVSEKGGTVPGLEGKGTDNLGTSATGTTAVPLKKKAEKKSGFCGVVGGVTPDADRLLLVCFLLGAFAPQVVSRLRPCTDGASSKRSQS